MADFEKSRQQVQARIDAALQAAGRAPGECTLLAVSKTFPAETVRAAYAAGQRAFGENYVQELVDKTEALADLADLEWHFIGPLQSNKSRPVAERAHWVHSVDRLRIAERLSAQRPVAMPPLNVCIQVNVSGEASKSGCDPAEALPLALAVAKLPGLRLRGLMCIPAADAAEPVLRQQFGLLRQLRHEITQAGLVPDTLSMGMSADLAQAIAEGSTLVRVGTALFGARQTPLAPLENQA
ncbi:YggS family pyridoxal phosphate-dependent enzyme [Chitinimonas sp. BJYL2]|uniref:YggS family pyridoxal phosphate-dependent enzyme n=1 Tax=Chitinimonas sp. BJYL2 TaxID=2976696 RepID=UPI0027E41380|nr:YggS family pyridoxal phosphate-dependent enzyme [Chitinimonas sp. BJYL2]